MARIMIVGGGCRGRRLAETMVGEGHAVRITTRGDAGRTAIEAVGAECWIGTPDRLASLRGALDGVTIVCWLLASASGSREELLALHGTRLELFLTQMIDTTVRGLVYEAVGQGAGGERLVRGTTAHNAIPMALLVSDPRNGDGWLAEARGAIARLLMCA